MIANVARVIVAAVLLVPASAALADGLSTTGPRISISARGPGNAAMRLSGTPVPSSPGRFLIPFGGTTGAASSASTAAQVQAIGSTFAKVGSPATLFASNGNGCCAHFAENSGARLAGGKTEVVFPIYTLDVQTEVFGFFVDASGAPIAEPAWLTRRKARNQSSPVIVPLAGGTAFAMWSDDFHEAGESDISVRGAMIAPDGAASGDDFLLERSNAGFQLPMDGVQLANGRVLLVWKTSAQSDILGQTLFYGRIMLPNGRLVGYNFLIGANNLNLFGSELRVAALPNGNFVAVWLDNRLGVSLPFFRIFAPNGAPTSAAQLAGPFPALGNRLDVAALSDSRFVIAATLVEDGVSTFGAQLFDPEGRRIGSRLVLQALGNEEGVPEHHLANAGYLFGQPPVTGGLATATDLRRVYLVWRLNQGRQDYILRGQALLASP